MRSRPTVLQSLIQHAKAEDYYTKGFAMLNCASFIRDTGLEEDTRAKAFEYYKKVVLLTNGASQPLDFMSKLAALVPVPRVNLRRYHGVFAPNSKHRSDGYTSYKRFYGVVA